MTGSFHGVIIFAAGEESEVKNLGIFIRFMLRRTWHGALCVTAVCAVIAILYPFRSLTATFAIPPVLGIFTAVIRAKILWDRVEIPYDEMIDRHGNLKPCPRCDNTLSDVSSLFEGEVVCSRCEVGYYAPKNNYLTHGDYAVISFE